MMIFLTILKIIGIVLCVILGIIAVILFVPICYELDADIDQKEFKARIHWLGRLVRFEFHWKEKAYAVLKILWFVIDFTDPEAVAARKAKKEEKARKKQLKQQKKEAKEREKQARQDEKEKQQEAADREARAQQREKFRRQQGEAVENESKTENLNSSRTTEETVENTDKVVKNSNERVSAEQEVSISDRVDNLEDQTERQADRQKNNSTSSNQQNAKQEDIRSEDVNAKEKQSVLDKLKAVHGKANSIKDKVKSGISVIQFLREQELIPAVWVKLKVFLLHIRPRVLQGHLKFGLSNPADTGQVLGGIAMVPFLYQTELQIEPDFEAEDNYIQGQVYSRGHMCCIHLVILIIRLLRDKKIRSVIHTIRENK